MTRLLNSVVLRNYSKTFLFSIMCHVVTSHKSVAQDPLVSQPAIWILTIDTYDTFLLVNFTFLTHKDVILDKNFKPVIAKQYS